MTHSQKKIETPPINDPGVGNSIQDLKVDFCNYAEWAKCTHNKWKDRIKLNENFRI